MKAKQDSMAKRAFIVLVIIATFIYYFNWFTASELSTTVFVMLLVLFSPLILFLLIRAIRKNNRSRK